MIKEQIVSIMQQWAPEETAEEWDNVGLQIDTDAEIKRVAIMLELNLDTYEKFQEINYDLVITHHPLIFPSIRSLSFDNWVHRVVYSLIQSNTGLYVSHTNLDKADDGVNDALIAKYNLSYHSDRPIRDGFGKIIQLNQSTDALALFEKIPIVAEMIPDDLEINTIAFCAGSGKSFVQDVIDQDVDFFITGELGYHDIQLLRQQRVGVFLLGHYQSEVFVLDTIEKKLQHLPVQFDVIV